MPLCSLAAGTRRRCPRLPKAQNDAPVDSTDHSGLGVYRAIAGLSHHLSRSSTGSNPAKSIFRRAHSLGYAKRERVASRARCGHSSRDGSLRRGSSEQRRRPRRTRRLLGNYRCLRRGRRLGFHQCGERFQESSHSAVAFIVDQSRRDAGPDYLDRNTPALVARRIIARSSRAVTTTTATTEPTELITPSPHAARFTPSSSSAFRKRNDSITSARARQACSPMPPEKTIKSTPPITATMRPISPTNRCRHTL